MKRRMLFLGAIVGLVVAMGVPQRTWAAPDRDKQGNPGHSDRDHGNKHYDNRQAYEDGYRDGDRDKDKRRGWHPRGNQWKGDAHEAYEAGYRAGFNGRGRDWHDDRDRDRDRDRVNPWDRLAGRDDQRRSGGQDNRAYRNGYTDGMWYGQHDRQARKPSRPTDSNAYEKASNGYDSSYGSRDDYKRDYRAGYRDGYLRGYSR